MDKNAEEQTGKIHHVIWCLEYLKNVSEEEGYQDIADLIDSTFKMCMSTFCILKRSELADRIPKSPSLSVVKD